MASSGKKKTTMAKLTRESRLRERRLDKQAKKDARKLTPAHQAPVVGAPIPMGAETCIKPASIAGARAYPDPRNPR